MGSKISSVSKSTLMWLEPTAVKSTLQTFNTGPEDTPWRMSGR